MPKEGDLRVWWIPQVPMLAFRVRVDSVEEGAILLEVLAQYDLYQYEMNVKPDYSNVGGLEVFEDGEWCDWATEATGCDVDEWLKEEAPLELKLRAAMISRWRQEMTEQETS